jgi:hypothetical protein
MERELGRAPVRKMAEFMDAYKVESADNGSTNTTGHRNRHIKRR